MNSIDCSMLQLLINKICNFDDLGFIVNSYYIKNGDSIKYKGRFNTSVFLTSNIIYNVNNIKREILNNNIKFSGNKLSYYEDKLLILMTSYNQKYKFINFPFYIYNKYIGITRNKRDFYEEISQAKSLSEIIIKNKELKNYHKKIRKYTIKKIVY